jgi:hypothetical protein
MSWFGDDAPLTHDAGVSGKWTDQIVLVSGKCLDGYYVCNADSFA